MQEHRIPIVSGPAGNTVGNQTGGLNPRLGADPRPTPEPAVSGEPPQVGVTDPLSRSVRCTAAPSPAGLPTGGLSGKTDMTLFFVVWLSVLLTLGVLAVYCRHYSPPATIDGIVASVLDGRDVWVVAWIRRKWDSYASSWATGRAIAARSVADSAMVWRSRIFAFGFVAALACWKTKYLLGLVSIVIVIAFGPGFLWGLIMPP